MGLCCFGVCWTLTEEKTVALYGKTPETNFPMQQRFKFHQSVLHTLFEKHATAPSVDSARRN